MFLDNPPLQQFNKNLSGKKEFLSKNSFFHFFVRVTE